MTLITVYKSKGSTRRCTAKCYDAANEKCSCVCGGLNHGKGQQIAVENTEKSTSELSEKYAARKDRYSFGAIQQELFLEMAGIK